MNVKVSQRPALGWAFACPDVGADVDLAVTSQSREMHVEGTVGIQKVSAVWHLPTKTLSLKVGDVQSTWARWELGIGKGHSAVDFALQMFQCKLASDQVSYLRKGCRRQGVFDGHGLVRGKVMHYAGLMGSGTIFPAIVLKETGSDQFKILDGCHRFAASLLSQTQLAARVESREGLLINLQ